MGKRVLVAKRDRNILVLGGIFFTIGVSLLGVALYLGMARHNENLRFERDGQVVEGKVLAKKTRTTRTGSGGSGTSFIARVTFKTQRGEDITGYVEMTPWGLGRLKEQGPIQVIYLKDDPQMYRVEGQMPEEWFVIVILAFVGTPFSVIGGLVVVFTIREHRKKAVTAAAQ
jgi:hypothetical protein